MWQGAAVATRSPETPAAVCQENGGESRCFEDKAHVQTRSVPLSEMFPSFHLSQEALDARGPEARFSFRADVGVK